MNQGYILARNSDSKWQFGISFDELNPAIAGLKLTLENWEQYSAESDFLKGSIPITSNRNNWSQQAAFVDTIYRKALTKIIPWQILLD